MLALSNPKVLMPHLTQNLFLANEIETCNRSEDRVTQYLDNWASECYLTFVIYVYVCMY